jgi:large subunit ribosomal protein L15
MKLLETLKPASGSTHNTKRLGRGRGSGKGGTSGKGDKGQKARKSGNIRRGFEGGQTPIHRRTPKLGFKNTKFRDRFDIVNVGQLEQFTGEVTPEMLQTAGFITKLKVKVLGHGEVKKALTVNAHHFSETAKAAIEKAGGKAVLIKKASAKKTEVTK